MRLGVGIMPATRTPWKHEPFTNGTSFPCQRTFSDEEFAKIRNGLIPLGMEDKWFISYKEPYVYFIEVGRATGVID